VIFHFESIGAPDLRVTTLADLLVNIEADFEVRDGDQVLYAERAFPVAELARELARWKSSPGDDRPDFAFDSMSFDEAGAVTVVRDGESWVVGSVFEPGKHTAPVSWPELATEVDNFVDRVRRGVDSLGLDPGFLSVRSG
jgi:predicted type IV restriction endonuclease